VDILVLLADAPPLIRGLDHHATLLLLAQISVLLLVARLLGEVLRKLGQPPVVGELAAGVLLGPSVFGALLPDLQAQVFPRSQHQADLLAVFSWIGVLFLLVVTGLETDLRLIKRRGRSALVVSAGGIAVPFGTGIALGWYLPDAFVGQEGGRLVFALFMAVAMSISAVPVIAKVLMDLKLIRRDIGQLILAAAMTDDTVGWILLSVVAGLATAGQADLLSAGRSVGAALAFIAIGFTLGPPIVSRIISATDKLFGGAGAQLSVLAVLALGAATFTHALRIEAILGAFVVGIVVAQAPRFRKETAHALELVTSSILAPVFFAAAGVRVDLLRMADPDVALIGLLVLAVACVGKFIGAYLGGWVAGTSHWERLALGSGMNARGAMEIVVATVGLGLGVITVEMYSIIVMVAIVTSLMAPPLLRFALARVKINDDEARRLEMEEVAAASFVRSVRRALLVSRSISHLRLGAQFLGYLSHEQPLEVTALYTRRAAVRPRWFRLWDHRWRRWVELGRLATQRMQQSLALLRGPKPDVRVVTDDEPAELVLVEAARGYDLVVVDDSRRTTEAPFGHLADEIARRSPCPIVLLKGQPPSGAPGHPYEVWAPRRIMVPTVGTDSSRDAVEVAAVLAASTDADVTVVYVTRGDADGIPSATEAQLAEEIVGKTAERGRQFGARVSARVVQGRGFPEEDLLALAREQAFDLVVLGSGLRVVSARAFFGHRVERIVRGAPCPVAIVSAR
jgi:Kef-type K+ transport system membrane component KefB